MLKRMSDPEEKEFELASELQINSNYERSIDKLEFKQFYSELKKLLLQLQPPQVVGLYGSWGSGKTVLMKNLIDDLRLAGCGCLLFDAWASRDDDRLAPTLLKDLAEKFKIVDPWSARPQFIWATFITIGFAMVFWYFFANEGQVVSCKGFVISSICLALSPFVLQNWLHYWTLLEKLLNFFKPHNLKAPTTSSDIDKLKKSFNKMVSKCLLKSRRTGLKREKLIIAIDNLDRCLPSKVVPLIEDISNYFQGSSNCIFVLMIDQKAVIEAIKQQHVGFDGAQYLEKIIQISVTMPVAKIKECQEFFFENVKEYYQAYFRTEASQTLLDELGGPVKCFMELPFLANPRRIKLIASQFALININSDSHSSLKIFCILLVLILKGYFPQIYLDVKRAENPISNGIVKFFKDRNFPTVTNCKKFRNKDNYPDFPTPTIEEEYLNNGDFAALHSRVKNYLWPLLNDGVNNSNREEKNRVVDEAFIQAINLS